MAAPSAVLSTPKADGVGVSISVHPLPILTISEHLTRARCQQAPDNGAPVQVFGALLGTQTGRDVEVHNTFEIKVDYSHSAQGEVGPSAPPQIDHAFFRSRQVQFKQTFPTFDFLGWYSNGSQPTQADMDVHKQLLEYSEAPIFLQFSPSNASILSSSQGGELPLQLYESQVEITSNNTDLLSTAASDGGDGPAVGCAKLYFVRSNYKIQTGEAERIAVDYASKSCDGGGEAGDATSVVSSLSTQQSAIRMLSQRIQLAVSYIVAVREGNTARDENVLRAIKSILAAMPAMDSEDFRKEFMKEYNDVLLTSFLSSMTKGLSSLNELVDKFEVISSSTGGHLSPDRNTSGLEKGRMMRERRSKGVNRS